MNYIKSCKNSIDSSIILFKKIFEFGFVLLFFKFSNLFFILYSLFKNLFNLQPIFKKFFIFAPIILLLLSFLDPTLSITFQPALDFNQSSNPLSIFSNNNKMVFLTFSFAVTFYTFLFFKCDLWGGFFSKKTSGDVKFFSLLFYYSFLAIVMISSSFKFFSNDHLEFNAAHKYHNIDSMVVVLDSTEISDVYKINSSTLTKYSPVFLVNAKNVEMNDHVIVKKDLDIKYFIVFKKFFYWLLFIFISLYSIFLLKKRTY